MEKGNSAKFVKIVILVAFLLGLSTYITFYLTKTHYEGKGNNSGTEEKTTKQEETVEDITNQELAKSLFNDIHIPPLGYLGEGEYGKNVSSDFYFTNSTLKVSDMDYDSLLSIAYNLSIEKYKKQLEVKTVKKKLSSQDNELVDEKETSISEELVKKTFKELYGNNKEYTAKTVKMDIYDSNSDYLGYAYSDSSIYYKDGKYVIYELRGLGGDIDPVNEIIYKATKYNDKIEILTAVCYREYDGKLYKDGVEKNLVTEIGELKAGGEDEYDKKIETYLKTNTSKFHNYKYTFNKEADGNYSFYSVEKVQ